MRNPPAVGLLEMTTTGFIGMPYFFTALRIARMLLPLPEIKIASFSNMFLTKPVKIKLWLIYN